MRIHELPREVLCAIILAALTGCSWFATYTYSDRITRDNLAQVSQADNSALQLHDDEGDQQAFRDGVSRFGDWIVGKTLGEVVAEEKATEQAIARSAEARDKAEAAQVEAQQSPQDAGCARVQSAIRERYGMHAGCEWLYPDGPGSAARFTLHVITDEYQQHNISKEELAATASAALLGSPHAGKEFYTSVGPAIVDP